MHGHKGDIVAVIPAAGMGRRLGKLPCSKELLPLRPQTQRPYRPIPGTRVAIEECLHSLAANEIRSAIVVIAPGKKDIPDYLGNGSRIGIDVSYLSLESSPSVPQTLSTALQHIPENRVVLVFPDILFRPICALSEIGRFLEESQADVTLALVPSTRGDKVDIVSIDNDGWLLDISAKPGYGVADWTWIAAAWNPNFSKYFSEWTNKPSVNYNRELYVADVLNDAIRQGFRISTVSYSEGSALDFGTPEDLETLWQQGF